MLTFHSRTTFDVDGYVDFDVAVFDGGYIWLRQTTYDTSFILYIAIMNSALFHMQRTSISAVPEIHDRMITLYWWFELLDEMAAERTESESTKVITGLKC